MTGPQGIQSACVICGENVSEVLNLGNHALANALLETSNENFAKFPLIFGRCPECSHGQLMYFVEPEKLFSDYLYASGTSQTLRDYFDWFASHLARGSEKKLSILELASNDGSLLQALSANGFSPAGIDPAENLCRIALDKGLDVKCGFFPTVQPEHPVDVIIAMNVAAHTPAPRAFVQSIADCLSPGGLALVQTSQANMIGNGEFDTIYHEHYSFFSVASMSRLAEAAGLLLEDIHLVSVHGTSFVFALRKPGAAKPVAHFRPCKDFVIDFPNPRPALLNPAATNAQIALAYSEFQTQAVSKMRATCDLLQSYGCKIGLVGVAAKALTFIRAAGIEPHFYFDEAPLKIGRYVPGATTGIAPLARLKELDEDVVLLIGAWNFAEELSGKIRSAIEGSKMQGRVKIVVHQPELREL